MRWPENPATKKGRVGWGGLTVPPHPTPSKTEKSAPKQLKTPVLMRDTGAPTQQNTKHKSRSKQDNRSATPSTTIKNSSNNDDKQ